MNLTADDLRAVPHVLFRNGERLKRNTITGVSTDSRTVRPGDLFVALKGPNFDGHEFAGRAVAAGACAVMLDVAHADTGPAGIPTLVVEETTEGLSNLARVHRRKFPIPVLAVGGSNGKTTTKEMIAAVLRTTYRVLSTEGNLNNQIGVPLTMLRLERTYQVAVVEIGTNHPGEVESLCSVLEPTHGLLTNIGHEHLEFLGTLSGVAREEGALFRHLGSRKRSVAFVNADDRRVAAAAGPLRRTVRYGLTAPRVDVRGRVTGTGADGCARLEFSRGRSRSVRSAQLKIPGEHAAWNALAAAAVGFGFRVPAGNIVQALERFVPPGKRMEILRVGDVLILNDTYNANPESMAVALKTLRSLRVSGKKIAVLSDMLELGRHSAAEHLRVGKLVRRSGVDYLLTYGAEAKRIGEAAGVPFTAHYDQKNVLAEYLAELVGPGDAVLVKGSRGMKMEDIVTFLRERLPAAGPTAPGATA